MGVNSIKRQSNLQKLSILQTLPLNEVESPAISLNEAEVILKFLFMELFSKPVDCASFNFPMRFIA